MYYNVRVKCFPDGTMQYMFSDKPKQREFVRSSPVVHDGSSVDRKKVENQSRRKQKVYDLARSNSFSWFVTLTFDPEKVDRFSYDSCSSAVYAFTHLLAKRGGFSWLLVPEQHKDGAFHFHGLIAGDLRLSRAVHPRTGQPMSDGSGRPIFNLLDFQAGFTTVTPISDLARAASYLTKYLTKDIQVPKGKKGYWASRNLKTPDLDYVQMTSQQFGEIYNMARWQKTIDSPYGTYIMCET